MKMILLGCPKSAKQNTLDCQKSMETCSLFFWKMCPETLLFGSNTVMDFSTNIKTEIKKKDEKKRKICQFPLEYVVSQVYLLFALLMYTHRYFFLP